MLDGQHKNGLKTAQAHEYIQKLNKKYRVYEWMNDEKNTIKVNNEVDTRRGRKLYDGDIVEFEGQQIKVEK